jgi:hypothetical protein
MIKVKVLGWHSKQVMGTLSKDLYYLHVAPGKTEEEALKNTSKELKRLAKTCDEKLKGLKQK